MDKPIIFKFIENGNIYIYDVSSGRLLKVSSSHWSELKILCDLGVKAYKDTARISKEKEDILQLLNRGFFSRYYNYIGEHTLNKYAEDLLERRVSNFTMQVTCDCNFKCRYCQYACSKAYERNHSNLYMDEEIAIKSLNFLHNHSCDSSVIDIGFYGGEPLLNFDIIAKSVMYSKQIFTAKKIRFNMTTNASLLTETVINFLAENDFDLTLSIDGPESIQNKHRRYLINGMGTFDTIYRNLLKLKQMYPNYFREKVKIHPVIMKDDNINEIIQFFQYELQIELDRLSPVYAGLSGIDYYLGNQVKILINDDYSNNFINKLENEITYTENKLTENYLQTNSVPCGSCLAGFSKLFVNINGDLFPCERVIELSETCVGNIFTGFNIEAVRHMLNPWNNVKDDCSHCWAFRLCSMCAVSSFCSDNKIENEKFKRKNCLVEKQKIADMFRSYVRSKEKELF